MALPSWLSTVPHRPFAWQIAEPYRPNPESEMQSGVIRSRRRNTLRIGTVSLSIRMTTAQYKAFRDWVRDTLGNGVSEFTMPLWDGTGCPTRQVRLRKGGTYTATKSGKAFAVSFELDVRGL